MRAGKQGVRLIFFLMVGCGVDGLILTPRSFAPTEPPRPVLAGLAPAGAAVEVLDQSGRLAGAVLVDDSGAFELSLAPTANGNNLRVRASLGGWTAKVVVPRARPGEITGVGRLDATTTAVAQLASYELLEEAGATFSGTPPTALQGLIDQMLGAPTIELSRLTSVVEQVIRQGEALGIAPFGIEGYEISSELEAADPSLAAEYRSTLLAAAQGFGLVVRCDPSRLTVMFTVDMSGRGRDGNGNPQLIRQPAKEGRAFLGFTADESSPVVDDSIPRKLTPNDTRYAMNDQGEAGDEVAGDGVYTVVTSLPRGARLLYKYTNGAAGEGFTGAEEWPGNARIIEVEDVLTGRPDGEPDCLVIRRDSFGDESSNKNFVNLHTKARERGGSVGFGLDLGGATIPLSPKGTRIGGLTATDLKAGPPLTPEGVPEARENGICSVCPAPITLDPEDNQPPVLLFAERLALDRVKLRFDEPLAPQANEANRYLLLDDAGRSVPVRRAILQGGEVMLEVEPTHPRNPARLRVRGLQDASVRGNVLEEVEVDVRPDNTPPKILSARALALTERDPAARPADPTVSNLVELILDEWPEVSAATDSVRYQIDGLDVLAAVLDDQSQGGPPRVTLVTGVQSKGRPYLLRADALRDPAGNATVSEVSFEGYALYRATFNVVVGFAYASATGAERGLPRGEKLYLTGGPLGAARGLDGADLSVFSQGGQGTDVVGWPQFELQPSPRMFEGQPIYSLTVLLPKGGWPWKVGHGVEGEYIRPPTTLEKVHKTLATTNDATGVRINPVTMIGENGRSYAGARLSESGDDPPRPGVVFKREAPDEVCEVTRDVDCPFFVVGTWRDLVLDPGGRPRDYDDGIVALAPHRPTLPDAAPPKLLDARAHDSFTVILSFDEQLEAQQLEVQLTRADDGIGIPVDVLSTNEVEPHRVVARVRGNDCQVALTNGAAYTVRYRGAKDLNGRQDRTFRSQTLLAPEGCAAARPLIDRSPPQLLEVRATDLTELTVRFDERLDPASLRLESFGVVRAQNQAPLGLSALEVLPDRAGVRLTTETQVVLEPYRLNVRDIADAADPANTLTSTTVAFLGFGERTPPQVQKVRAIDRDRVLVVFDEPVDASSALDPSRYVIQSVTVQGVAFAGDPGRRNLAFNPALAPKIREAVLLTVSPLSAGVSYPLQVTGVRDLSGNPAQGTATFLGVDAPPTVDVVIEYEVSDARRVAGSVPARALGPRELANSREGLFILGARATPDHAPVIGAQGPVNDVLSGFGLAGQPLDGIEPRLVDNGAAPDRAAGDAVYSILVPRVPLGTTLIWKAFAPFTTRYRDQNPNDRTAAFADVLPGPSVFSDGQEYPGNENGAVLLDEGASPGLVRIRCVFGDEVTYKKSSGQGAYMWIFGDQAPRER